MDATLYYIGNYFPPLTMVFYAIKNILESLQQHQSYKMTSL